MEPEVETKVLPEPAASGRGSVSLASLGSGSEALGRRAVGRRYELVQRLGYGGMAMVYLARVRGLAGFEKQVAVKIIHQHLAAEPEFVEMFLNEARTAARLHSPHIGEVLDVGEDGGLYYMVMEYIEGETLSSLLRALRAEPKGTRLPVAVILQILADACTGLSAVHTLRDDDGNPYDLVHRDVSPQNLLITVDGWVKLVDFGIVKATGIHRSTLTGHLRGKLPYMAPEQARGKAVSRASDVFALGAILWELCTGKRLFAADTDAETLTKVMRCEVPKLADVLPASDVPPGLQDLLDRALTPDPSDRFPTAAALLRAVQRCARRQSRHDGEDEPRTQLAAIMQAYFGEQVAYRRAAVRRSRESAARPVSLVPEVVANDAGVGTRPGAVRSLSVVPGGRDSAVESVGHVHLQDITPAHVGRSGEFLLGGHDPSSNLGGVDEPQTLTTTSTPLSRPWALWLLPFLGAGIAVMAINFSAGRGGESDANPSAPTVTEASSEPADSKERVEVYEPVEAETAAERERVMWLVTSDPPGAVVSISGVPEDVQKDIEMQLENRVTPVKVELPLRREPVTVRVEKDGFSSRVAVRMPVTDENITFHLAGGDATQVAASAQAGRGRFRFHQPGRKSDTKSAGKKSSKGSRRGEDAGGTTSRDPDLPLEPTFKPLRPREDTGRPE